MTFQTATATPLYAALQDARAAYEAALIATFGDHATHFRYSGPHTDYPDLAAAYGVLRAADAAFHAQFAAA